MSKLSRPLVRRLALATAGALVLLAATPGIGEAQHRRHHGGGYGYRSHHHHGGGAGFWPGVALGVGIGVLSTAPYYYPPAYYAPPPVYYAPPPVYYAPPAYYPYAVPYGHIPPGG